MKYDHDQYLKQIFRDEEERIAFAEHFETTDLAMRHATLRANQEARAASLAASAGPLKSAVDRILADSPSMPLEQAFRLAAREAGIL